MKLKRIHFIVSSLVMLAVAFMALGIVSIQKREELFAHSLKNWQDADSSPGYPMVKEGTANDEEPDYWAAEFNPNLSMLTSLDRYRLPVADSFTHPMGSESGALTYDAQGFYEDNPRRGGRHLGNDYNGIGGEHTDLGDPVFAIGNGMVVYTGEPSRGWGKVVILAHRMSDGRLLQSFYAHLDRVAVHVGKILARGQKLGTVGTGNNHYYAHLHFEIRESDGVDAAVEHFDQLTLNAGYSDRKFNRLDAAATLEKYAPRDGSELAPSVLKVVIENRERPSIPLSVEDAKRLSELKGGE